MRPEYLKKLDDDEANTHESPSFLPFKSRSVSIQVSTELTHLNSKYVSSLPTYTAVSKENRTDNDTGESA